MAQTHKISMVYCLVALAILLPLLLPGYILTLDMVFTPRLRMPGELTSSYGFHALLHVLNLIVPSQVLQKIMLASILVLSSIGTYRLLIYIQRAKLANEYSQWGAFVAGALYMVNPYTYSRFMAGQYAVLLGYALLPFCLQAGLHFFAEPTKRRALQLSAWVISISIVSIHTVGLLCILIGALGASALWQARKHPAKRQAVIKYGLLGAAVFLLASSYWLLPLVLHSNTQGRAVAAFSTSDRQAFATVGGSVGKRVSNVLQLRGFWAEGRGLYLLPQNRLPGWPLVMLIVWALIGVGGVVLWRQQRGLMLPLLIAGIIALLLATTGLTDWLSAHLPLFSGYREPHKFVGIIALVYAICVGVGIAAVLSWAQARDSELWLNGLIIVCLLLPILYTPTMFWGFAGQLSPREYPSDWTAMNSFLNTDHSNAATLFLPWHLYMSYGFAGRIIASPAHDFFDTPVIASNELEFRGASPTAPDAQKTQLSKLLRDAANNPHFSAALAAQHIKYVLLAKDYDFQRYEYLQHAAGLRPVRDTEHLTLYEVTP